MSKVKLGLGMIIKDETDDLRRILSSYKDLFDEIQITITCPDKRSELEDICKFHKAIPSYFEWKDKYKLFPFDVARNFNMKQFKEAEYYFRLDADDEIIGAKNVISVAQKAKDQDVDLVMCFYDYARDEWGNTVAGHNRETIIKITDNLFWNKHIHENILPVNKSQYKPVIDKNISIKHLSTKSDESSSRNIKYLIEEYNQDKEKTDPRTLAYLGRVFTSVGKYDEAIFFLQKHIQKSGWDEDRYMSWCYLADIYRWQEKYDQSLSCCFEALTERTDYPDAYFKLHDAYFDMGKWERAIEWGKIGVTKKAPESTMIEDPSSRTWRPALSIAFCYFKLGKFNEAKKLFDYGKSLAPNHSWVKNNEKLFEDAVLHKKYTDNFVWMLNFLKDRDKSKLESFVQSIPTELLEEPAMIGIRNAFLPESTWGDKSVVFYCGQAWEEWSPLSVKDGIGGSEEAVIHVSKQLVKLGYDVTVYNSCGDNEGVHEGVKYINYYKFNKRDEFNILIAWRCSLFKFGVKAKKKIIWLHDVPEYILNDYDEKAFTDKVIVLSEYHKSLLVHKFPEEKIYVSANGVNAEDFIFDEPIERDPYTILYASSYDRGLENIFKVWPEVKQKFPQAKLKVCYGWNTYDKMFQEGAVDGSLKKKLTPMLAQDGVIHLGRIGHKQLAKEYLSSGIWFYPTNFPEISCIAAMKAQVSGCVPVCTDFAALKETVKAGAVVPGGGNDENVLFELKMCLLELLGNTEEQERVRQLVLKNKDSFSWGNVAKDWSENLFSSVLDRKYIDCRFAWVKSLCKHDDKIVDIGGNDGHTFEGWNRDNVTTVDIDEYDIPNFVRGDACNVPLPDKSFDVACLNEILEHIPDPVTALKEASRVATKKIIITVPNEHEWPKRFDPMMTIEEKEKKEGKSREVLAMEANPKVKDMYKVDQLEHLWHIRYYTNEMLEDHLKQAGLTNYKITKLTLGEWAFYGAEVFLQ